MRSAPAPPVRELIRRYASAWLASLPAGAEVLLVDAFAGRDHPAASGPVPDAVRAVREERDRQARRGGSGHVSWLLLEEDPAKVEWLRRGLAEAGVPEGEEGGAVTLEEATPDRERLAERAAAAGHVLFVLDPPRPEHLPLELVEALLSEPERDAVIRLPTGGLRRLAAHRGTPLADLPPLAKRAVEGWSRLLGDPRRGWASDWWAALSARGVEGAVAEVAEAYAARLRTAGRRVARRALPGGDGGAPEQVVVACGEPGRVLLVNAVLDDLRAAGAIPWEEDDGGLVRHRPTGVIELFGAGGAAEERERDVDVLALAHRVASGFEGRAVVWRDVLDAFLDTALHEEDLRRAALELRRDGRALFRSLAGPDAPVAFPRGGRRPAPRRRGGGRGPDGDLSLPLDGGEAPPGDGAGR